MACIAMSQPMGLFEPSPSPDGSVLLCDVPFLESACDDFQFSANSADVPDDLMACTPVHGWDTPPESPVHSSPVFERFPDPLLNQHVATVFDPLSTTDFTSAVSDMGSVFDWTPPASPISCEADSLIKDQYLGMPFGMDTAASVAAAAAAAAPAAPVKSNKRKSTSQLSDYDRKKAKAKADGAEKAIKAARKEGGKKGQDLAGMHDLGGMIFFTVCLEEPKGDWKLMEEAMVGANKEPDPDGDDRKGGAGQLYKCFLSCDESSDCKFLFHGPKATFEKDGITLGLKEWAEGMLNDSGVSGAITEWAEDGCSGKAVAKKNEEKQLFPLKQRDAAINVSFNMLRTRALIPEDSSGSEADMSAMYEDAGVEW